MRSFLFGNKRSSQKETAAPAATAPLAPAAPDDPVIAPPPAEAPAPGWFRQMSVLPATRRRIWVIGGIYGRLAPLADIHDRLMSRMGRFDALVYAGNMIGHGPDSKAVIDEILLARRRLLSLPGMTPADFVWIRGGQEELWRKLLELQYVAGPKDAWSWLMENGARPVVESYGASVDEGEEALRGGTVEINRWCAALRARVFDPEGHNPFYAQLRHAATTRQAPDQQGGLLITASGLNPDRDLERMSDHFWWNHKGFDRIQDHWQGFDRVIRGNAPEGTIISNQAWNYTLTAGLDAPLPAVCFTDDGGIDEIITLPETKTHSGDQHQVA